MSMQACASSRGAPRSEAVPCSHARPRRPQASAEDCGRSHMGARGRHRAAWEPTASRPRLNLVGVKVVVVDDDEDSADYFALALRAYGAVVATAYNAIDGLRLVQEHQPNVVLSDIAMMGQDGYWLVREIRRLPSDVLSRVPVVATTAYGREHSRQRTLAAGFSEHLAKPVDPDLLRQTIGRIAGR